MDTCNGRLNLYRLYEENVSIMTIIFFIIQKLKILFHHTKNVFITQMFFIIQKFASSYKKRFRHRQEDTGAKTPNSFFF